MPHAIETTSEGAIGVSLVDGESSVRRGRQLMLRSEGYAVRSYPTCAAILADSQSCRRGPQAARQHGGRQLGAVVDDHRDHRRDQRDGPVDPAECSDGRGNVGSGAKPHHRGDLARRAGGDVQDQGCSLGAPCAARSCYPCRGEEECSGAVSISGRGTASDGACRCRRAERLERLLMLHYERIPRLRSYGMTYNRKRCLYRHNGMTVALS